jgi:predicted transcriptional regulator
MHTPRCGRPYHARTGITVRLPADVRDRVQHIATAEHRSIAGYVQSLIERDLRARDEAERIIHVFAELQDELAGTLVREAGETEDRYSRRAEILRTLLDGH